MTPKEKAKDLIDKYVGFKLNPYDDPEMKHTKYKAKLNALICLKEIEDLHFKFYGQDKEFTIYLLEVANELEYV